MIEQKALMAKFFSRKLSIDKKLDLKIKKLSIVGEQVQPNLIDFNWTLEEECKRLGISKLPKLLEVNVAMTGGVGLTKI